MKSPAFQFYPGDWLSSPKIMLMTPAQEGGYIRLLCYAWADPNCSLPDDDEILATLSRLGEGWFKGGSTVIRKCFNQVGTTLVNERLLREREKQKAWSEKSRQGGINSGVTRGCNRSKGGSRVVEPKGNSSSSSSSSFSKEEEEALEVVVSSWNSGSEFSKCLSVTERRKKTLNQRLSEPFFSENWSAALERARKSQFCLGKNDRGWKADFDWFLKPDSVPRLIEGKYDDRNGSSAPVIKLRPSI